MAGIGSCGPHTAAGAVRGSSDTWLQLQNKIEQQRQHASQIPNSRATCRSWAAQQNIGKPIFYYGASQEVLEVLNLGVGLYWLVAAPV